MNALTAIQQREVRVRQIELEESASDREFERVLRNTFIIHERKRRREDLAYSWAGLVIISLSAAASVWILIHVAMWAEHWR